MNPKLNPRQIKAIKDSPKGMLPAFLKGVMGATGKAVPKTRGIGGGAGGVMGKMLRKK